MAALGVGLQEFIKRELEPLAAAFNNNLESAVEYMHRAEQAAREAAEIRAKYDGYIPKNPIEANIKNAAEHMAKAKEATAKTLESFAKKLSENADSALQSVKGEMIPALARIGQEIGAIAGFIDMAWKAADATKTGDWAPLGGAAMGAWLGAEFGLATAGLLAGMSVGWALVIAVGVGFLVSKFGENIVWPALQNFIKNNVPESFWNSLFSNYDRIADAVSSFFGRALVPRLSDPLAIDLDGDGIETLPAGATVLFDHNADGVKTGTGWLASDDAWLVRDLNGNGLIDSGRELFGVDTRISYTSVIWGQAATTQTNARTGFEALGALDSNGDRSSMRPMLPSRRSSSGAT